MLIEANITLMLIEANITLMLIEANITSDSCQILD